jgi:lipopolysaccharide/colanic/teichoic acid biosynthesis glycosyltransferase
MADKMAVMVPRSTAAAERQGRPDGGAAERHRGLRERMRDRLLELVDTSGLQRRGVEAMRSVRGSTGAHLVLVASEGGYARALPALAPRVGSRWLGVKRVVDIACAGTLLLLLAPVMFVVALCVSTSGQPILFRQARVGRNGRIFKLVKFRTMVPDAEARLEAVLRQDPARQEEWIRTQKLQNDPRITVAGSFLRRSSLDELPQLFNVLAGDMSLVGPRPEVKKYVDLYNEQQKKVLSVRPGITDYASIEFINENELLGKSSDPEKTYIEVIMPAKLKLNLRYINEQGFGTDIKIIFKTLGKIVA